MCYYLVTRKDMIMAIPPNPNKIRKYIIKKVPTLSRKYKLQHIILPTGDMRKDKTQKFLRNHHYAYPLAWRLTAKLLSGKNVEYLPPSLFKDPFLNVNHNLYAYVYRVSGMYVKYVLNVDNLELSFRSLHRTSSKDKRFKSLE